MDKNYFVRNLTAVSCRGCPPQIKSICYHSCKSPNIVEVAPTPKCKSLNIVEVAPTPKCKFLNIVEVAPLPICKSLNIMSQSSMGPRGICIPKLIHYFS